MERAPVRPPCPLLDARSARPSAQEICPRSDAGRSLPDCHTLWVVSFVRTIDLPASPESSLAFVVDGGGELEPMNFEPRGEQRVGTLNDLSGRIAGIPIRAVSKTVEWDPPRRCAFESVKPSWPISARIVETFESSGTGTWHTIHYEVTPGGLLGRLPALLVCRLMRRSRRQYQERLRDALAVHPDS